MGHLDDDNVDRYTITVYVSARDEKEVFNGCTDVESGSEHLTFFDRSGKHHEFYGIKYHVAME